MSNHIVLVNKINKEISTILSSAIVGTDKKYRPGSGRFIRWELVEQDIHDVVGRNILLGFDK